MNRFAFVMLLCAACSSWTAKDTSTAVDVGKSILCAIEHAELDDPQLNALCGELTPEGKSTLAVHRAEVARSYVKGTGVRTACKPSDGGTP